MITIYINGCSSCGINSRFVQKVKDYAARISETVDVVNTRYNKEAAAKHLQLQKTFGLGVDDYVPIVVEGNGVTRLLGWQK